MCVFLFLKFESLEIYRIYTWYIFCIYYLLISSENILYDGETMTNITIILCALMIISSCSNTVIYGDIPTRPTSPDPQYVFGQEISINGWRIIETSPYHTYACVCFQYCYLMNVSEQEHSIAPLFISNKTYGTC